MNSRENIWTQEIGSLAVGWRKCAQYGPLWNRYHRPWCASTAPKSTSEWPSQFSVLLCTTRLTHSRYHLSLQFCRRNLSHSADMLALLCWDSTTLLEKIRPGDPCFFEFFQPGDHYLSNSQRCVERQNWAERERPMWQRDDQNFPGFGTTQRRKRTECYSNNISGYFRLWNKFTHVSDAAKNSSAESFARR